MQDDIRLFVRGLLEKKARLAPDFDEGSDFLRAGIIDSMAIIKFVLELEARYDIALDDADIESDEFRSVRGLVALISRKKTEAA